MNHIVLIVLDSARYDAFAHATAPNFARLGALEQRYSYASWTPPSHYAMLMGALPHRGRPGYFAAVEHRHELLAWSRRMGLGGTALDLRGMLPRLSLPMLLRSCGYRCEAYVSMPVLNSYTLVSADFDRFELMPTHDDFEAIIARVTFSEQPTFFLLNLGETHYPYTVKGERADGMPHVAGLHGVVRQGLYCGGDDAQARQEFAEWCSPATLRRLQDKQTACIEHVDALAERLYAKAPDNSWFVVTSDHGELFGEDGFFGHGPVSHEKVFEVFLVEGRRP
jgi:hypothetical protein